MGSEYVRVYIYLLTVLWLTYPMQTLSCSTWELINSLTRDQAPCIGNMEYQPLDHQVPLKYFLTNSHNGIDDWLLEGILLWGYMP